MTKEGQFDIKGKSLLKLDMEGRELKRFARVSMWFCAVCIVAGSIGFSLYLDRVLLFSEESLHWWFLTVVGTYLDARVEASGACLNLDERSMTIKGLSIARTGDGFFSAVVGRLRAFINPLKGMVNFVEIENPFIMLQFSEEWKLPFDGFLKVERREEGEISLPQVVVRNGDVSAFLPVTKRQVRIRAVDLFLLPREGGGFSARIEVGESALGRLRGWAALDEKLSLLSFHVVGEGADVKTIMSLLPPDIVESLKKFEFAGKVKVTANGSRREGESGLKIEAGLSVESGSFKPPVVATRAERLCLFAKGMYEEGRVKASLRGSCRLDVGCDVAIEGVVEYDKEKGVRLGCEAYV
ncbi:MAG: hypothetical protein N2234_09060, partial [Planctomycetota bacterium]|nr:hypothetical protein [Planctomycetota bacterium]